MEYALRDIPNLKHDVGYAGGTASTATYYTLDNTDHSEAVRVVLEAAEALPEVLGLYASKQAGDPSPSSKRRYRRGVLCETEREAELVAAELEKLGCAVPVGFGTIYIRAEPYHQDYYRRTLDD
jgi:peptide methionine sulfoxide reductase MsrA